MSSGIVGVLFVDDEKIVFMRSSTDVLPAPSMPMITMFSSCRLKHDSLIASSNEKAMTATLSDESPSRNRYPPSTKGTLPGSTRKEKDMGDKRLAGARRRRRSTWGRVSVCCGLLAMCGLALVWLGRSPSESPEEVIEARRRRLRPIGGNSAADAAARKLLARDIDTHERSISSVVHSIGGKRVVVVDGAIGERERKRVAETFIKLTGNNAQHGWHREKASDMSLDHNAMAKDMPYDECDGTPLSVVRTLAPHFYDRCRVDAPIWVTRCSIYMQTFIDIDEAHQDRSHDAKGFSVTAIWYPNERWHPHWGGETVFLSDSGANAELLLPVLPKPGRLLLFDSEIDHMAKPASAIAEPFRPAAVSHVMLPSTRTTGNRYSFVLRTMCSGKSVDELFDDFDTAPRDRQLSRSEVATLFNYLEIDRVDGALEYVGCGVRRGRSPAQAPPAHRQPPAFHGRPSEAVLRRAIRRRCAASRLVKLPPTTSRRRRGCPFSATRPTRRAPSRAGAPSGPGARGRARRARSRPRRVPAGWPASSSRGGL